MSDVWMRVGINLQVTPEEKARLFDGEQSVLISALMEKRFSFNGDTYIPTDKGDVDFDLPNLPCP